MTPDLLGKPNSARAQDSIRTWDHRVMQRVSVVYPAGETLKIGIQIRCSIIQFLRFVPKIS